MIKLSTLTAVATALCFAITAALPAQHALAEEESLWPGIAEDIFGDNAKFTEEDGSIVLEAPYRAEDAALVPLTIRIPAKVAPKAKTLTLIIEKNPAPMVAKFEFGPAAGMGERVITTRVRVDMYSNVRAVIKTKDGNLFMTTKFVKAAGGCSAPGLKDADEALANLGKMKLKSVAAPQQSKPGMKQAQNHDPSPQLFRHANESAYRPVHPGKVC